MEYKYNNKKIVTHKATALSPEQDALLTIQNKIINQDKFESIFVSTNSLPKNLPGNRNNKQNIELASEVSQTMLEFVYNKLLFPNQNYSNQSSNLSALSLCLVKEC